ncbi:MAG: calcium-binding protein [Neomegalonema sp.]|nr:calcium-binding protein [Neomegalonema sp.]
MKKTAILAGLVIAGSSFALLSPVLADGPKGPQGGARGPQFLERFEQADTNGDGKVTPDEIEAMKAARFSEADADKDGVLTAEEMAAHAKAQFEARFARHAERRLKWMDKNGDGVLSLDEMDGPGARMAMRLDRDGDGAISREEAQAAQERFAKRFERRGEGRHMGRGGDDCGERGRHGEGRGWFGGDND